MPRKPITKHILGINCVVNENLPYPFVHYPGFYGAYFAFSESNNSQPFLCSCSKTTIQNALDMERELGTNTILKSGYFPEHFGKFYANSSNAFFNMLDFADGLCHRCNMAIPLLMYCDPMYGGKFKQKYGWYINQAFHKVKVKADGFPGYGFKFYYDDVVTPDYIKEKIILANYYYDLNQVHREPRSVPTDGVYAIDENEKLYRKINRDVEDIARQEFGFKKIGDGWASETLLYNIVCRIFPREEILRHHRPEWLNKLELDIYLPNLKMAFEYQGQQHYYPVELWGGEETLKKTQERDRLKAQICHDLQMKLFQIKYTEPLSEDYIKALVQKTDDPYDIPNRQ